MNTKELECFLAVCEEKSINKAAKTTFISVQGLSRMIKKIEAELEAEVQVRTQQGIELTDQGRILEKHARTIIDHMSSMNLEIEKSREGFTGELKVALSYGILGFFTPLFVVEFGEQYPEITLQFEEYTDKKVRDALWYGDCDIAITMAPVDDDRFEYRVIDESEIFLVINRDNPLSRKDYVTIDDLREQSLVIQNREFNVHRLIRSECPNHGFEPKIIFESNGVCMCNKLCQQNRGISVCMRHTIEDIKGESLKLVPFKDSPYSLKIILARRKDSIISREMEEFEKFILEWSETHRR